MDRFVQSFLDSETVRMAFQLLEESLSADMSGRLWYIPEPYACEDLQDYYRIVPYLREIYAGESWIPQARTEYQRLLESQFSVNEGYTLVGKSHHGDSRTEVLWQYLLAILYNLASKKLLDELKTFLKDFQIEYCENELKEELGHEASPPGACIRQQLDLLPMYVRLERGKRNFTDWRNFFDLFRDVSDSDWIFILPQHVPLLTEHKKANYPWTKDDVFLRYLLETVKTNGEYGGCNLRILQPVIEEKIVRGKMWKRRAWSKFSEAIRAYLYSPGMPGASRMSEKRDEAQGLIAPCNKDLKELRTSARLLVCRMSRKELQEFIGKFGPDHHVSL